MTTTHAIAPRMHRTTVEIGVLVGLAILLVTQDPTGHTPFALIGIALFVAVHGYLRNDRSI